jgi:hypothetical protein
MARPFNKTPCDFHAECGRLAVRIGLCNIHYQRMRRTGKFERSVASPGTGRSLNSQGYVIIWRNNKAYKEHVFLAEKALGKLLPKGAVVHHMNENKADNFTPLNLVVCPDQAYHALLHKRMRDLGYSK